MQNFPSCTAALCYFCRNNTMPESAAFLAEDLKHLPELQPPDWGDLGPRFEYFIAAKNCAPVKFVQARKMVAVGTTIKHRDTAWLACIIVHPDFRNRGLGAQMTRTLMESLDPSHFKTIYLDATEMGYPVYKKLGFQLECSYSHFRKIPADIALEISPEIQDIQPQFCSDILQLDKAISGEDRSHVLEESMAGGKVIYRDSELLGFYLPQLSEGLVIAANVYAGVALTKYRVQEKPNAAFPTANKAAMALLPSLGFELFRTSRRMFFGEKRLWKPEGFFNRISGQLG